MSSVIDGFRAKGSLVDDRQILGGCFAVVALAVGCWGLFMPSFPWLLTLSLSLSLFSFFVSFSLALSRSLSRSLSLSLSFSLSFSLSLSLYLFLLLSCAVGVPACLSSRYLSLSRGMSGYQVHAHVHAISVLLSVGLLAKAGFYNKLSAGCEGFHGFRALGSEPQRDSGFSAADLFNMEQ